MSCQLLQTDTQSNVSKLHTTNKQQKFHQSLHVCNFLYSVTPTEYNKKQHPQQQTVHTWSDCKKNTSILPTLINIKFFNWHEICWHEKRKMSVNKNKFTCKQKKIDDQLTCQQNKKAMSTNEKSDVNKRKKQCQQTKKKSNKKPQTKTAQQWVVSARKTKQNKTK